MRWFEPRNLNFPTLFAGGVWGAEPPQKATHGGGALAVAVGGGVGGAKLMREGKQYCEAQMRLGSGGGGAWGGGTVEMRWLECARA